MSSHRYGFFIDYELIESFPSTIEGYKEALKLSNSEQYKDVGELHEVHPYDINDYIK